MKLSLSQVAIRITVMMDDENAKKLRALQAKRLRESQRSVSFSQVLNEQLKKSLK